MESIEEECERGRSRRRRASTTEAREVNNKMSNANLTTLMAMAEESQERERRALEELQVVKRRVLEEQEKERAIIKMKTKKLQEREREILSKARETEEKVHRENEKLRKRLEQRELQCASLREELAQALQTTNSQEEHWHERTRAIESAAKALIASTADTINPFKHTPQVKNNKENSVSLCLDCAAKSDVIETLRSELSLVKHKLQDKLEKHSDYMADLRTRNQELELRLNVERDRHKALLEQMDQLHGSAEEAASQRLCQAMDQLERAQAEKRMVSKASDSLVQSAEKNYHDQVTSSSRATGLLREMLEAEKRSFESYRKKVQIERENWREQVEHLEEQLEHERELCAMDVARIQREKDQLSIQLGEAQSRMERAEEEQEQLQKALQSYKKREQQEMSHVLSLWKERQALIVQDSHVPQASSAEEKKLIDKLEEAEKTICVLQAELKELRTLRDTYKSEIESLSQDKLWLRKERDAVAQGFVRQQECLQSQLHVVNKLREALELGKTERSKLLKNSARALEEIRVSFESK